MHNAEPISDLNKRTELGGAKASVVHQAFTDTTTWDEIILILEEEALRNWRLD